MQTVSACMIVKNEEEMLPRCLESIRWVDQLVIIDTGSTDRTVDIANSFGAEVHHREWENNFSLHRNQSIEFATGDWIFIIDADEELVTSPDPGTLQKRLGRIPNRVGAMALTVREVGNGTEWVGVRLFRRKTFKGYRGIVHNKSEYEGECAGSDLILNHYGYSLSTEKMIAKHKRSETLLRKRLEENPDDFIAMYYLQQLCVVQNRAGEAVKLGNQCFDLYAEKCPDAVDMQYLFGLYYMQAVAHMKLRDGGMAAAWALKGLERREDEIDLHYIMASIGYEAKRDDLLEKHGRRYLELYDAKDQLDGGSFANALDGGRFLRNVTVFTRRPDSKAMVEAWLKIRDAA